METSDPRLIDLQNQRRAGLISRRQFMYAATLLVGSATAASLAAACSPGTPTGSSPGAASPGGSPAASEAGTPKRGGTLRVAMQMEPSQPAFDLHEGGLDVPTTRLSYAVYEGLIDVDADRNLIPNLAESWEIPDPTTYLFNIRSGVKFQDGTALDAEAVKFNIDRIRSPESKGDRRADFAPVTSVDVVGPMQVRVKIDAPNVPLLGFFRRSHLPIMSPTAINNNPDDPFKRSIGTGPFQFESYTRGDRIVMRRFDDHWGEKAYLDAVEMLIIPEQSTALAGLQAGTLDYIMQTNPGFAKTIEADPNLKVLRHASPIWDYIAFNCTRAPFDDVRVRQAFSMAIDRAGIANAIYSGYATPGNSAISPAFPDYFSENADIKAQTYDPTAAKALLESINFDFGKELVFDIPSYPPWGNEAQAIIANLTAIGINVKAAPSEFASHAERIYGPTHDFLSYTAAWTGGGVDPDALTYKIFLTGGPYNISQYSNKEVDALLAETREEFDVEKRAELFQTMNRIVMEECPVAFTVWPDLVEGMRKEVMNYQFHDEYAGGFDRCWLDV
jgi:ABC-type transport system substrate-binding protein